MALCNFNTTKILRKNTLYTLPMVKTYTQHNTKSRTQIQDIICNKKNYIR